MVSFSHVQYASDMVSICFDVGRVPGKPVASNSGLPPSNCGFLLTLSTTCDEFWTTY